MCQVVKLATLIFMLTLHAKRLLIVYFCRLAGQYNPPPPPPPSRDAPALPPSREPPAPPSSMMKDVGRSRPPPPPSSSRHSQPLPPAPSPDHTKGGRGAPPPPPSNKISTSSMATGKYLHYV